MSSGNKKSKNAMRNIEFMNKKPAFLLKLIDQQPEIHTVETKFENKNTNSSSKTNYSSGNESDELEGSEKPTIVVLGSKDLASDEVELLLKEKAKLKEHSKLTSSSKKRKNDSALGKDMDSKESDKSTIAKTKRVIFQKPNKSSKLNSESKTGKAKHPKKSKKVPVNISKLSFED
ncbi:hypothetical protein BB558_006539 [Smittium angustum]|uniref:DUF4604 domain-containing protein n=1 Tax=Smittium angustum TaxID=133377 RepID=A0A2U1IXG3_SMIAN|nr:hypothetical protein BB558_006539 [Smittium angustum]